MLLVVIRALNVTPKFYKILLINMISRNTIKTIILQFLALIIFFTMFILIVKLSAKKDNFKPIIINNTIDS